ncbi:MAG: SHOCT domain-containing protein [Thermoproteota archaeon]|nr:SHOCT domain-containing protein [Thermoproteota archaeon]
MISEESERVPPDHEVIWQGVVKIDPSISVHMPEGIEAGNGLKFFTIRDSTFPYSDNAQLDNPDLATNFPNDISIYVTGAKILEYMKCSIVKWYKFASSMRKTSLFRKKRQQELNDYFAKRIVAAKGFLLSPVNTNNGNGNINHVGCLASVKVSNEYGESIIFEKTGLAIFASGSKTSDITFTNQRRSVTTVFVASYEKPFVVYTQSKATLIKLLCDSSGIKTEKTLQVEDRDKALPGRQQSEDPLQILKIRLAKGEISVDEYNKLRRLIADDEEKNLDQGSNWI